MSVNDVPMAKNESRYLRHGDRITIVKPTFRFEYGEHGGNVLPTHCTCVFPPAAAPAIAPSQRRRSWRRSPCAQ